MGQGGNNAASLYTTPGVYIEFTSFALEHYAKREQRAVVTFRLHLLGTALNTQDKRIDEAGALNHFKLLDEVYDSIRNFSALSSAFSEFNSRAGTDDDYKIINSVQPGAIIPDHRWAGYLETTQEFKTVAHWKEMRKDLTSLTPDLKILHETTFKP